MPFQFKIKVTCKVSLFSMWIRFKIQLTCKVTLISMRIKFKIKLTPKVTLFSMPIKLKIKLACKSSPNMVSLLKTQMLELLLWSPMVSLAPLQFSSFNSLTNHYFFLISCILQCSQKFSLQTPLFSHNLSFNGDLINNNDGKMKMTLRLILIVIQSHLWTVVPTSLGCSFI